MKVYTIPRVYYGWLLLFFVITCALWYFPTPNQVAGSTDEVYNTLQISGSTANENTTSKWLSFFYGLGIVGLFSCTLYMSLTASSKQANGSFITIMGFGVALYIGVYIAMVNSWWSYTQTNSMDYFLGLPKPTAWMFGLMLTPLFFSLLYFIKFEQWIYTKEDEKQFQKILENRKNKQP